MGANHPRQGAGNWLHLVNGVPRWQWFIWHKRAHVDGCLSVPLSREGGCTILAPGILLIHWLYPKISFLYPKRSLFSDVLETTQDLMGSSPSQSQTSALLLSCCSHLPCTHPVPSVVWVPAPYSLSLSCPSLGGLWGSCASP